MNVGPNKKKDLAVKDVPSDMPGVINFTPELIARVATFSEAIVRPGRVGASDVKNMCHAVGPMPSRIIKYVYLKKNLEYLQKVVQLFFHRNQAITCRNSDERDGIAEWARECHLAWMSVNTGWRSLVTDELMERYEYAKRTSSGYLHALVPPSKMQPLLGMINPAVAIEMDLLEALQYLVEVKGIDVNATRWVCLSQQSSFRFHLVATAIRVDNHDAFQYLMSADAIDIYRMKCNYFADASYKKSIFSYAMDQYIDDENKKRYFDAFVKHSKFRANRRFLTGSFEPWGDTDVPVTCLHHLVNVVPRQSEMVELVRIVDAIKYLLTAGANPKLQFHDLWSPLELAIDYRGSHEEWRGIGDTFSKIVRIMSEHSGSR